MKSLVLGLVLAPLTSVASQSTGATKDSVPDVASLRAPATPAFVLLGVSPTDVARPQTPGDLSFALLSKAGAAAVPNDLSLEISPYWLSGRPALSWKDDRRRSIGASVQRTFALSVATAEGTDAATPVTSFGVGVRFMLLSGHLSDATVTGLTKLDSSLAAQGSIFNRHRSAALAAIDARVAVGLSACLPITNESERFQCATRVANEHQPAKDSLNAHVRASPEYQSEIAAAEEELDDIALVREGWNWEVAGGATWNFVNAAWDQRDLFKTGIWTTLSREGGKLGGGTTWAPVFVYRYLTDHTSDDFATHDFGARFVMSAPTYSLSAEVVRRIWSGDNAPSGKNRIVGMAEYRVRSETWLFAALGKDYEEASAESFITRFGVSLSLKKERYKAVGGS